MSPLTVFIPTFNICNLWRKLSKVAFQRPNNLTLKFFP